MSNNILSQMTALGERLREERARIGLNQTDFAALGGVQRDAQLKYETDKRTPDAAYFGALFRAGIDIQYVITGVRSSTLLSKDEIELLAGYRELDIRGKAGVLGMISGMSTPQTIGGNVIHGKVGQQIIGDITGSNTVNMSGKKSKK